MLWNQCDWYLQLNLDYFWMLTLHWQVIPVWSHSSFTFPPNPCLTIWSLLMLGDTIVHIWPAAHFFPWKLLLSPCLQSATIPYKAPYLQVSSSLSMACHYSSFCLQVVIDFVYTWGQPLSTLCISGMTLILQHTTTHFFCLKADVNSCLSSTITPHWALCLQVSGPFHHIP